MRLRYFGRNHATIPVPDTGYHVMILLHVIIIVILSSPTGSLIEAPACGNNYLLCLENISDLYTV